MCAFKVTLEVAFERIPTIRAIVTNTSADKTITAITWDTPLDENALDAGVFVLVVLPMAQTLAAPGPSSAGLTALTEDLAQFGPGSSVSHSIGIRASWIPRQGQYCQVQAKGRWKAVWEKPMGEIQDDELNRAVREGNLGVDFISNIVEIRLT